MEAMQQSWTDDRIDDLAKRVDEGFAHVDARFKQIDDRFGEVHDDLAELRTDLKDVRKEMATKHDFDAVNRRLDTVQWTINGAILTGFLSLVVTQIA